MMIGAIIQARMSSTRLPGKIMKEIAGKPMLWHLVNRLKESALLDKIIIATTSLKEDKVVVELADSLEIAAFTGSETDVLDRYYKTAKEYKIDTIVRITGDCPLLDPKIVDDVVELYIKENADYATNTMSETFPDGEDVEVFSFNALKISWEKAELNSEREHVTPYIRKNFNLFKIVNLEFKFNLADKRWTVDNQEDFEFIKIIYENLYPENPLFGIEEILSFLAQHPEVEDINKNIQRNEGYLKSLRENRILNLSFMEG